jgi:hypothetical protein
MPKFITNIQLQDADKGDYIKLTEELKKELFIEEKNGGKSRAYVVKDCVLSKTGNITLQEINNEISKAALKTGKKFSYYTVRDKQHAVN